MVVLEKLELLESDVCNPNKTNCVQTPPEGRPSPENRPKSGRRKITEVEG
jgi:hypothetical protein